MGAQEFQEIGVGTDVTAAFTAARDQALWEHGHGGYTGSLAEKDAFVVIATAQHTLEAAEAMADALIDAGDARIWDKWGPAGAIRLTPLDDQPALQRWLFFGIASS